MNIFLKLLGNKFFLWVLIIGSVLTTLQMRSCQLKKNNELNTYNRQLQGQLSDKERELQSAHKSIGVSESKLLTQIDLAKKLRTNREEVDKKFEQFKKKHNLDIKSRDRTIAQLQQQINGGSSGVVVDNDLCKKVDSSCVIGYWWHDPLKRFQLKDPNIFNKNDEIFSANQLFKIYGEIFQQQNGSLQIRRLVLREVQSVDGKYKDIDGGKAKIVISKFEYSSMSTKPVEFSWRSLFRLRAIGVGSTTVLPSNSRALFGGGMQFFQLERFGINTHTILDFKNISQSEQRLGLSYSPNIYDLDLNVAAGLSVGTPFIEFFDKYSINLDLIFYIND